jgi:murein DD-endopeptidase MepM/ murein hydrolase activator NlpD
MQARSRSPITVRAVVTTTATVALLAAGAWAPVLVRGQDVQGQLDQKQSQLQGQRDQRQVLTTDISRYTSEINQLAGEVEVLQQREAQVTAELDQIKAQLRAARERLVELRDKLHRSVQLLKRRLVAMYKEPVPDAISVVLNSDGFDDMLARFEYLQSIHNQDTEIIGRVRSLRDQQASTVGEIESAKRQVAAKRRELARTRAEVEARQADLQQARSTRQGALDQVDQNIQKLEGDVSGLQNQVQADLNQSAPAPPSAPSTSTTTAPDQSPSSSGLIWPVNGPITSYFCEQRAWEACHPGIDIGVPAGTPIQAAASGTVTIAAPYGGYGNYTCIDHGGGLSTCYAHQSSIQVSVGQSVSQGDVIGLVGCTGLCFGDHLHFEVRVNGAVTDPLNYLS